MDNFSLWGFNIPLFALSSEEMIYLKSLPDKLPPIEWIWKEMDRIWDGLKLNNKILLEGQPIHLFYSHPVWLINGVFSEQDALSNKYRTNIAHYINSINAKKVADYGGGFGSLSRKIAMDIPSANVHIIEPFPSNLAKALNSSILNISFHDDFGYNDFDVCIAQDVLEHVEDPIALAFYISKHTKTEGFLIFANCFYPVIKCHLPNTFHLRYTFPFVMRAMGLKKVGNIKGAEYAEVYEKYRHLSLKKARNAEKVSKIIGPLLNFLASIISKFLKLFK